MRKLRAFPDLMFAALAEVHDQYSAEFTIYSIYAISEPDGVIEFAIGDGHETTNIEEAEKVLTGRVKWDGCSDWRMEKFYMHACCRDHLTNLGEAMAACHDWTAELLPHWEG